MKRRYAILLAIVWVGLLLAVDAWCVMEFRVAEAHLKVVLDEMFAAPVSFGRLSMSPILDLVATDVRLMRPDNPQKLYGTIDEVRVTPRWIELLTRFRLEVKEIAVQNPTLVVKWHETERTFDMPSPLREDLEARTTMGELPAIALKGLTLSLENPPEIVKQRQNFSFEHLSITLAPEGSKRWLYRFEVDVNHPILGNMKGVGKFSQDAFVVELQRKGLMVTQDLLNVVTPEVRGFLEGFSVDGDLTVTATVGPVEGGGAEAFSAAIDCQGMSAQVKDWPQALTSIRGRVDYSQGRLSSKGLTAEFEKAPLEIRGSVALGGGRRVVDVSGEIIGLGISNALASRIRKLPDPCPTVAEQIEAWDPDGFANISFRLLQERDANHELGPLHPSFEVEFKGATVLRYVGNIGDDGLRHGFAYPLQDLRGLIKFTDQAATFDRLTAMNGSLAVEAHGRIDYEAGGDETYDIDVAARGLRLDEKVSAALKGSARELFNSLDADGSADLAVAIKRQKGEPPGPRVDITVDLQGVGMRARTFPLDLEDVRGRVVITDAGPIKVEKVTAKRRGGSLALRGVIPVDRVVGHLEIDLDFEKFPLDPSLTIALKELVPDAAETLVKLNPTGRIDGTVHVALEPDGSQKDLKGSVRFDNMTLAPEDPSVRLDDLAGSIALAPSEVTINQGTTASIAGERFAVQGTIKSEGELDLRIEAENFQVDRELMGDVEPLIPWIRRFQTRPELTGPMSLKLHVIGPARSPDFGVELDFNGVDVVLGAVPGIELRDLHGHVSISPGGAVRLRDIATRIPSPVSVPAGTEASEAVAGLAEKRRSVISLELAEGVFDPPAKSEPKFPRGHLTLTGCAARGVEITPAVIGLLPIGADLKERLSKLGLSATVDLSVGALKWDGVQIALVKSRLQTSSLSLGDERSIRADSFTIDRLTVKAGAGLLDLGGEFILHGARFFDIPVPRCSGKIAADAAGVRFEALDGDIIGYETRSANKFALGKINPETSRFEVRFDDGWFDSQIRLQEVNVPAVIRVLGGNPGRVSGTLRCAVDLSGVLSDVGTYKGTGDLSIRARNVVSLPMFYKMFNSLDVLSVFEKNDPWTKVEVDFAMKDRVLHMPKIRIDTPDVLLAGPGTLTFAGMIKADLKTEQGMGISPIGWVTRLISHAVFAGVRVEGPVGDPRVDAYGMTGG